MNEIIVKSHAKINIGLNIIGKRDDGFHNLETIFYPINLFDEIVLRNQINFLLTATMKILIKKKLILL
jgi:4-diphosphocytidyl-2-C-methyl-D-erythritol kinase